jgi:hypothetical protein
MACKSLEREENHQKPPALVVAKKPNGKSRIKNGAARQGAFWSGKTNQDKFLEPGKNHQK